ncbi:MAG: hypothetical protein R6U96_03340 [Promethearchaeia archaeon]
MGEDIFFYIDISKKLLKRRYITKAIKFYIENKRKVNQKGRYGALLFQEEGNPVFITDKKDSEVIIDAIKENWKNRPKKKSHFENGLFYIFSYISETVRKKPKFYRIIVITDTPSDLSEEYQDALFNLISKIKIFPTFIDIIRVEEEGKRFFKDDVKLNVLVDETNGEIFYVHDKDEFRDVIKKLVKNKQLVRRFQDKGNEIHIDEDDYNFYRKLAKTLEEPENTENLSCYFCEELICPICVDINDVHSVCEECGSAFHHCCLTNYVMDNNIGIPNIFRCPECHILLQIEEREVKRIKDMDTELETVKDVMGLNQPKSQAKEEVKVDTDLKNHKFEKPRTSNKVEPSKRTVPNIKRNEPQERGENVKKIRVGGFFGSVYTVRKKNGKIIYQEKRTRDTKSGGTKRQERESPQGDRKSSVWTPTQDGYNEEFNHSKSKLKICPICGSHLRGDERSCPNCDSDLSNF